MQNSNILNNNYLLNTEVLASKNQKNNNQTILRIKSVIDSNFNFYKH